MLRAPLSHNTHLEIPTLIVSTYLILTRQNATSYILSLLATTFFTVKYIELQRVMIGTGNFELQISYILQEATELLLRIFKNAFNLTNTDFEILAISLVAIKLRV